MKLTDTIKDTIQSEPGRRLGVVSSFLLAASFLFRFAVALRNLLYDYGLLPVGKVDARVISIGNITAGGTGKTPMVIYTAELLLSMGEKVGVVSRGYGREAASGELLVCDGRKLLVDPGRAGEEPFLIAGKLGKVPVVVSKDRYAACKELVSRFKTETILLDDAFQHRKMYRDLDIVLLDATRPFGNGYLLPRGLLREPTVAIARASAVIITRASDQMLDSLRREIQAVNRDVPVFSASFVPRAVSWKGSQYDPSFLKGKRMLAFAGIGNPGSFQETLKQAGADIIAFTTFDDHHRYEPAEIKELLRMAGESNAILISTEKDGVKIEKELLKEIAILEMKTVMGEAFTDFIRRL